VTGTRLRKNEEALGGNNLPRDHRASGRRGKSEHESMNEAKTQNVEEWLRHKRN
jgi:hypothetical protein